MSYSSFISLIFSISNRFISFIIPIVDYLLSNFIFKTFIYLILFDYACKLVLYIFDLLFSFIGFKDNKSGLGYSIANNINSNNKQTKRKRVVS